MLCKTTTRLALTIFGIISCAYARADEQAVVAQAREILAKHQGAVVWVAAVAKVQVPGGRSGEQEAEAIGTVIDPSGLVVVAEEAFNPVAKLLKQFSGSMAGGAPAALRELKVDLTQVTIRLPDGTELPSKIVLKDPDLGLAFVLPDKPAEGAPANPHLPSLELTETPEIEVLDEVISLGRLGKTLDYQPTLALGRISAVVAKPRELYWGASGSDGAPVFTAGGELLGIAITHAEGATVIVPVGEVMATAKQALSPEE